MFNPEVDAFFDDELTVSAVYQANGQSAKTIQVIFDRDYVQVGAGGVAMMSGSPAATCRNIDVSDADNKATLTVATEIFNVVQVQRDKNGFCVLILTKADASSPVRFEQGEVDAFMDDELLDEAIYWSETSLATPGSSGKYIKVIFSRDYAELTTSGISEGNTVPTAQCRTSDISDVTNKCRLTIGGEDFKIREIQPDGTGFTILLLGKL